MTSCTWCGPLEEFTWTAIQATFCLKIPQGGIQFVLSDFGKSASSSSPASTTAQFPKSFRGSIDKLLGFLLAEAKANSRIWEVMQQIIEEERSLRNEITSIEHYFEHLMEAIKKAIKFHFHPKTVPCGASPIQGAYKAS
ncbi:hypothetical protein QOT17_023509 [Balamuthia mandrillaris]